MPTPPPVVLDADVAENTEPTLDQAPTPTGPIDPIPGIMEARCPHLIIGSPSAGKTRLVAELVRQIQSGGPVLCWDTPDHRPVPWMAYMAGNKAEGRIASTFLAAGVQPLPTYSLSGEWHHKHQTNASPTDPFPRFTAGLKALAKVHGPIPTDALIIVDEISLFFDFNPSGYYNNVAATMKRIASLCEELSLTLLLLHITCKGSKDKTKGRINQLETINGSAAILRHCSCKFLLLEPEESTEPELGLHELLVVPARAARARMNLETGVAGAFTHAAMETVQALRQAAEVQASIGRPPTPTEIILEEIKAEIARHPDNPWIAKNWLEECFVPDMFSRSAYYRHLKRLFDSGSVEEKKISGEPHLRPTVPS